MPRFRYEHEFVQGGLAVWWRWACPECDRHGELKLTKEQAKKDARRSHGYGGCPDGRKRH